MDLAESSNEGIRLESRLSDVLTCQICSGLLKDARFLPCGHSYCLKCLEGLEGTEEAHPACPQCKKNFEIPPGGMLQLPENVYVGALVQLRDILLSDRPGSGDEADNTSRETMKGETALESRNSPRSPMPASVEGTRCCFAE